MGDLRSGQRIRKANRYLSNGCHPKTSRCRVANDKDIWEGSGEPWRNLSRRIVRLANHAKSAASSFIEGLGAGGLNYFNRVAELRNGGVQPRPDRLEHLLILLFMRRLVFVK